MFIFIICNCFFFHNTNLQKVYQKYEHELVWIRHVDAYIYIYIYTDLLTRVTGVARADSEAEKGGFPVSKKDA